MRTRALIVISVLLLVVCFFAGALNARRKLTAAAILEAPRPAPASLPQWAPAPSVKHVRRFTPPPIPENDPGVAELVNAPSEPTPEMIKQRHEETDRRLEELFGTSLPVAKRDAVRAAQVTWMREHQHAVQEYYHGEINQPEFALRIHQNMLIWASQIQAALSPDEFRRYTDLEPGADPYVQLVPPSVQVGDHGPGSQ
jgi:hypothetical protein